MGFDPISLGAMAVAAGAGLSAVSTLQAGQQAKKWGEYNAAVSRQDAIAIQDATEYEVGKMEKEGERLKGTQRVSYAKGGVSMEGTPSAVIADTARDINLDIAAIRHKGRTAANKLEAQAGIDEIKAGQAERASYWGAASTILSGAGSTATAMWGPRGFYRYTK